MLLDFFVEAPGRGARPGRARGADPGPRLVRRRGPGVPRRRGVGRDLRDAGRGLRGGAAVRPAAARSELVAPAATLARDGVELNAQQAYIVEILERDRHLDAGGGGAVRAARGSCCAPGSGCASPSSPTRCERLGAEGPRRSTRATSARRSSSWVSARGGALTRADLAAYDVVDREPLRVGYRGREVLTNPPPSAGGILIARALALLDGVAGPPSVVELVEVMERTQHERTPEFLAGLDDPEFVARFPGAARRAGWGRPRTSPRWTATAGRAR